MRFRDQTPGPVASSRARWVLAGLFLITPVLAREAQPEPNALARSTPGPRAADHAATRPTVLVLMPLQPGRPLFDTIARGIRKELLRASPTPGISIEYLYDWLDPPEVNARQLQFLRAKYAGRRVDVVIAVGHPKYARVREDLGLPAAVPIVLLEGSMRIPPVANSTRVMARESVVGSYEFARALRPAPHHVAVIGGASITDRHNNAEILEQLAQRLPADRIHDLTGLAGGDLRAEVEALPAETFVLIGAALADRRGRPVTQPGLLAALGPENRRPVVVANDLAIDDGVLGGVVFEVEAVGARVAHVAARLLTGTPAAEIAPLELSPRPVVDARQIERHGIDLGALPAGTTVLHRPAHLWEGYRAWILTGVSVLLVQSVLIGGLLSERRRRLRSQEELAQRLRMQALVADISSSFAEASADRVEARMLQSLEDLGRVLETNDCALWTWQAPGASPRLVCRWVNEPGALPVATTFDELLLAWARPRLERGEEVHVSDLSEIVTPEGTPVAPRAASVLLPLRVDGRVVGVLSLAHPHSQAWTRQVIGDLRTIGGIIATAVVRARAAASSRAQLETLAHVDRVAGLGEAAASIAHELSQPLAAILSNAEVAQQLLGLPDPPLDEVRDILVDVIADDERAGGIIRNMRTALRKRRVEASPIHVNVVAAEIRRLVAHDARMRRTPVHLELGQGVPLVYIDETQLKQVLLNLVVNAVDAMTAVSVRAPVHVRTSAADDGAALEVRDLGPGIPAEVLGRVFDPFVTTKADGLGVGLAISRSILEAAGGRISATNADGGGAVFRVWLPAHTAGRAAEPA